MGKLAGKNKGFYSCIVLPFVCALMFPAAF